MGDVISIARELADAPSLASYLDNLRSQSGSRLMARRFDTPKLAYHHPDRGDDPRPDPHANADTDLVRRIGERLQLHYPGHPWRVEVEHAQGVARISIPAVMGWNAAYTIHLTSLKADPGMKCVTKAGGEILERYRLSRSGYDFFAFAEACKKVSYGDWRKGVVPT